MDPEFPRILFAYGQHLERAGDKAGAAEYLRRAVHFDGGQNKGYVAALRKAQRELDPALDQLGPLTLGSPPKN